MAIYSSKTELNGSTAPTGLGANYSTQGRLATFNFPVNGQSIQTSIQVDSAGGTNSVTLVGPDGRPLAYYNKQSNTWNAPAGQGNSTITNIIIPQISSTPGLANALSQSAYYTAYHKTGNSTQATKITGVSPSTQAPTVAPAPIGLNGSAPQNQPQGGGLLDLLKPLDLIAGISTQFNDDKGDKFLSGLPLLSYPKDILQNGQDILKIEQFRYQPPRASIFTDPAKTIQEGIQRSTALQGNALVTVLLPIPNNLADSNNVSWGPDNMNALTAAAAGQVLGNIGGIAGAIGLGALGAGGIQAALNALTKSSGGIGGAAATGASLGAKVAVMAPLIKAVIDSNNNSAKTLAGTAIGSQILNMSGFEVSPESILANAGGIVPNSNLELLFNAPTLREFRFDYRFSPRSKEEADMVKQIIRSFKQGMAPRKLSASAGAGAASYFLGTPNVFRITYRTGGKDGIQGLNKFKICALTGFAVNYTPDGQWSSYEEGQPVSYMVSMSFNELEPVYETDYQETISSGLSNDLQSVGPNDIGY